MNSSATASGLRLSNGPPFRADVVGSFMRPPRLNEARVHFLRPQTTDKNLGPHGNADLKAVEDDCIREVVAMQEDAGLRAASDGEVERRSWWVAPNLGWSRCAGEAQGRAERA